MSICLVDTSVFCEPLRVPMMYREPAAAERELKTKIDRDEHLMLPMVTIIETGNHIGQNGDGRQRRKAAETFVRFVSEAIRGQTPFTPTRFFEQSELLEWLVEFPDWAARGDKKGKGSGLGDLTIKKEWETLCSMHHGRRVYIWSLDEHLSSSYDTGVR